MSRKMIPKLTELKAIDVKSYPQVTKTASLPPLGGGGGLISVNADAPISVGVGIANTAPTYRAYDSTSMVLNNFGYFEFDKGYDDVMFISLAINSLKPNSTLPISPNQSGVLVNIQFTNEGYDGIGSQRPVQNIHTVYTGSGRYEDYEYPFTDFNKLDSKLDIPLAGMGVLSIYLAVYVDGVKSTDPTTIYPDFKEREFFHVYDNLYDVRDKANALRTTELLMVDGSLATVKVEWDRMTFSPNTFKTIIPTSAIYSNAESIGYHPTARDTQVFRTYADVTYLLLDTSRFSNGNTDFFDVCDLVDSSSYESTLIFNAQMQVKLPSVLTSSTTILDNTVKAEGVYNLNNSGESYTIVSSDLLGNTTVTAIAVILALSADSREKIAIINTNGNLSYVSTGSRNTDLLSFIVDNFMTYPFQQIEKYGKLSDGISLRFLEAIDIDGTQSANTEYSFERPHKIIMGSGSSASIFNLLVSETSLLLTLKDGGGYYEFEYDYLKLDVSSPVGIYLDDTLNAKFMYINSGGQVILTTFKIGIPLPKPTQLVYDFRLAQYGFIPCQTRYMGKGGIISKV